jgi:hypothetical protein
MIDEPISPIVAGEKRQSAPLQASIMLWSDNFFKKSSIILTNKLQFVELILATNLTTKTTILFNSEALVRVDLQGLIL